MSIIRQALQANEVTVEDFNEIDLGDISFEEAVQSYQAECEDDISNEDFTLMNSALKGIFFKDGQGTVKKADKLMDMAKGISASTPTSPMVKLGSKVAMLSQGKASTDFKSVMTTYSDVKLLERTMVSQYLKGVNATALKVTKEVSELKAVDLPTLLSLFETDGAKERLGNIEDAFNELDSTFLTKLMKSTAKIGLRGKTYTSTEPFVGNMVIYEKGSSDSLTRGDLSATVSQYNRVRYLIGTDKNAKMDVGSGEVKTLTPDECVKLMTEVKQYTLDMLDTVEKGEYTELFHTIQEMNNLPLNLMVAGFPVTGLAPKVKTMLALPYVFNKWRVNPYMDLLVQVRKVNKAAIALCEMSLKQYK